MSMLQHRVPAGVPTGGRFAATTHGEADIALRPVKHLLSAGQATAVINSRYSEGAPRMDLTADQVSEVQRWVDLTGDFSYRSVRSRAEEVYLRDNKYTPGEYADYLDAGGSDASLDPEAVRRDIEQMRKDRWAARV